MKIQITDGIEIILLEKESSKETDILKQFNEMWTGTYHQSSGSLERRLEAIKEETIQNIKNIKPKTL
jgi:hypothetical protein